MNIILKITNKYRKYSVNSKLFEFQQRSQCELIWSSEQQQRVQWQQWFAVGYGYYIHKRSRVNQIIDLFYVEILITMI